MKPILNENPNHAEINHAIYDTLGDLWYTADDNPIAMLRAVSRSILPWTVNHIENIYGKNKKLNILDIGCGGGFLSNPLAQKGFRVTGIDLSINSLQIARKFDATRSVKYIQADANSIPLKENQFDVITCMDFLEHVPDPAQTIAEAARLLKPGGYFFFHTFNRNFLADLIVIKLMEWFIKNTPKNLHLKKMFITTKEMKSYLQKSAMQLVELKGLEPKLNLKSILKFIQGEVASDFSFAITDNVFISYIGFAKKK